MYESKHVYKWIEKFLTDRTNMFDESLGLRVHISYTESINDHINVLIKENYQVILSESRRKKH